MAWPTYSRTTEKPAASATFCTARPTSLSRLPHHQLIDAGPERTLGDLNEAFRERTHFTDGRRVGGVPVVPLDDGAGVHGDDVALLQHVVAGNSVDDHVVGARADHRRKAVVVQKVRASVSLGEYLGREFVELSRRDPGSNGRSRDLVHLGHDLAGLAHLCSSFLRITPGLALGVSPSMSAATFSDR